MHETQMTDRTQASAEHVPDPCESASSAAAPNALARAVAHVWAEMLGVPSVALDDDFFSLGGESMVAMRLSRRLCIALTQLGPREFDPQNVGWQCGVFGFWLVFTKYLEQMGKLPDVFLAKHLLARPGNMVGRGVFFIRAGQRVIHTKYFAVLREYVAFLRENGLTPPPPNALSEIRDDEGNEEDHEPPAKVPRPHQPQSQELSFRGVPSARLAHAMNVAARNSHIQLLQALLLAGVDVNAYQLPRALGMRPLHHAAQAGDEAGVALLLRHGALTTAVTYNHAMAAHFAAALEASRVLQLLLATGSPIGARDCNRQSLLHYAARNGSAANVAQLLACGQISVNATDCWHRTALHWAVLNGHAVVVALLAAHPDMDINYKVGFFRVFFVFFSCFFFFFGLQRL
jgi:hypothetical protein